MFYVYKITNKISGKVYVGKAKDALKRFRTHLKIAKGGKEKYPRKFHAIHAAMVKYGIDSFTFEIFREVETECEAFLVEQKTILDLKINNLPTYNLSNGGEGNSGWQHTEEAKQKMSKSRKGKIFTEEHKQALSAAQSGKLHSQYGKHQTIEWKENKSILTALQVKEIKNLLSKGILQCEIAKSYHVSQGTISYIKNGKTWSDVTP
jgi:group I intron endonuclease